MKVSELAVVIGGTFEGDGSLQVIETAALHKAEAGQVSFVDSTKPRLRVFAQSSRASCLIVPPEFAGDIGRTLIRVARPRVAFLRVTRILHPRDSVAAGIHPTAVIAADATIDESAHIGPYVTIGARCLIGPSVMIASHTSLGSRVTIGAGSQIDARVVVYDDVTIGSNVNIYAGAVIGALGFGYEYVEGRLELFPQHGGVIIGDDVDIGANSCVDRGLGGTSIGTGTKIDNLVHIGHNCTVGRNVLIAAQTGLSGGVVIEDQVMIGGQVGIGENARLCSGVRIGGQAGIYPGDIVAPRRSEGDFTGTPVRTKKQHHRQMATLSRLSKRRRDDSGARHE